MKEAIQRQAVSQSESELRVLRRMKLKLVHCKFAHLLGFRVREGVVCPFFVGLHTSQMSAHNYSYVRPYQARFISISSFCLNRITYTRKRQQYITFESTLVMLGRNACLRTRRAGLCLLFFMGVCLLDLAQATFPYFGGYEPLTDVTEHSKIDLDLIDIIGNIGGTCGAPCLLSATCPATSVAAEGTGCNYDGSTLAFPSGDHCEFSPDEPKNELLSGITCDENSNAYDIWLNGQHSDKGVEKGIRKISGFASGAAAKSSGHGVDYKDNKYIAIMNKYWKSKGLDEHTWGYDMIKAAFDGTTVTDNSDLNFGTVGRDFRKEAIQKGIVYLNVFPYVIWEMQDQVNDCNAGTLTNNDDGSVHAWDEAVAFYTGSTVGGSYGTSDTGKLQFALADKRCGNFKTCTNEFSGGSQVNADILALFNAGKEAARTGVAANGDCDTLDTLMDKISALSLVPFVQGVMRYLYKTKSIASAKEAGELWAFATAVLPFVNEVDSGAAEKLYQRAWAGDFSANSYEDIKSGIESTLTRLGAGDGVGLVTCSMIGDLYDGTVLSNVGCSDSNSNSKKDKEIELGVGLGLGLPLCASLVAVVFLSVARHRNQRKFDELLAKQTTLRDNYNKV